MSETEEQLATEDAGPKSSGEAISPKAGGAARMDEPPVAQSDPSLDTLVRAYLVRALAPPSKESPRPGLEWGRLIFPTVVAPTIVSIVAFFLVGEHDLRSRDVELELKRLQVHHDMAQAAASTYAQAIAEPSDRAAAYLRVLGALGTDDEKGVAQAQASRLNDALAKRSALTACRSENVDSDKWPTQEAPCRATCYGRKGGEGDPASAVIFSREALVDASCAELSLSACAALPGFTSCGYTEWKPDAEVEGDSSRPPLPGELEATPPTYWAGPTGSQDAGSTRRELTGPSGSSTANLHPPVPWPKARSTP